MRAGAVAVDSSHGTEPIPDDVDASYNHHRHASRDSDSCSEADALSFASQGDRAGGVEPSATAAGAHYPAPAAARPRSAVAAALTPGRDRLSAGGSTASLTPGRRAPPADRVEWRAGPGTEQPEPEPVSEPALDGTVRFSPESPGRRPLPPSHGYEGGPDDTGDFDDDEDGWTDDNGDFDDGLEKRIAGGRDDVEQTYQQQQPGKESGRRREMLRQAESMAEYPTPPDSPPSYKVMAKSPFIRNVPPVSPVPSYDGYDTCDTNDDYIPAASRRRGAGMGLESEAYWEDDPVVVPPVPLTSQRWSSRDMQPIIDEQGSFTGLKAVASDTEQQQQQQQQQPAAEAQQEEEEAETSTAMYDWL